MKIYREEAKGLVGKYCLFSDRCMDIEDCIIGALYAVLLRLQGAVNECKDL